MPLAAPVCCPLPLAAQAFPGPVSKAGQGLHASGIPADHLTAAYVYREQSLPEIASVAASVTNAVCGEIWTCAVGNPGTALPPDLSRANLALLQDSDMQYLLVFAVLLVTAHLHKARGGAACLDPVAFPTSSRSSGRSRREARRRAHHADPQQQAQRASGQQQQEPEVAAWHVELEAAMKITGCVDAIEAPEVRKFLCAI